MRNVILSLCLIVALMAAGAAAQETVTTPGGTTNAIPVFTGNTTIGNSAISQSGGNVTMGEVNGVFNPSACATVAAPSWCSATLITAQTPGSGYTAVGGCTVTGGTVTSGGSPSGCGAWLRNTGIYVAITSLGSYSSPPTGISVSGTVGGTGFSASVGTGSDLGFWVNAAFAYCNLACTVHIPAGTYTYSTTINMTTISQSLVGDGPWQTKMTYTGSGDGVFWQTIPFSVGHAGRLKALTLLCTSAAANCVHSGTIMGSTWEDLLVSGATGTNANNVLLENADSCQPQAPPCGWTERTYMRNVWFGDVNVGGSTNLHLTVNGGTSSFGYSDIQLWQSVEAGQQGVVLDSRVFMYNSSFDIAGGNVDTTNSKTSYFKLASAQIFESRLNVYGEAMTTGNHSQTISINGQILACTGTIQIYAPDAPAGNGYLILPTLASGSFISLEPFNAADYPLGSPIAKAYQPISADGTIVAIQAANNGYYFGSNALSGRLILVWPNNSPRFQEMVIDVGCVYGDTAGCTLNVVQNYAEYGEYVITNPRLVELSSSSQPQILVDVGNRNGVSQNIIATWYGDSNETVFLLPGSFSSIGTVPVTSHGSNFSSATTYGLATLSSGTVTVSNPLACTPSANCIYRFTRCASNSSAAVGVPTVGTVTVGTSFVIKSLSSSNVIVTGDLASICWQIN